MCVAQAPKKKGLESTPYTPVTWQWPEDTGSLVGPQSHHPLIINSGPTALEDHKHHRYADGGSYPRVVILTSRGFSFLSLISKTNFTF